MSRQAAPDPREIGALVALLNQNRFNEAERGARTLLAGHSDAGILWKVLSVALLRQNRDALQALRRAAELLPNDAEAHGNLGAALHDQERWAEALMSLGKALAIHPDDAQLLIDAADATRALGRANEAVALYERAMRINPRGIEAHNNLGNTFMELGKLDDAVSCYRRALEVAPQQAQIHCNLGNALRRLGHLEQALASSRRALALDQNLGVAHNTEGLILAALGHREQAVASYRRALALNAHDLETLNSLGNLLRDLGEYSEAVSLYALAAELDPGRAESHSNLGNALLELRRIDEAVASFEQALALQPESTLAHVSLATALRLQHRADDAERHCRAALIIDPNHVDALSLLGELRADRGQFSEAEEFFRRAIAINPQSPFAFFSIAAHRKMTGDDGAWLESVEALLRKPLALQHEVDLRYALGKYFDDLGQFEQAFSQYRLANELNKRHASRYDPVKLAGHIDAIISRFDAKFLREQGGAGAGSELPVFIIGMPRSGTSLTEQILASHPAVFGAGELTFWDAAFARYQAAAVTGDAAARPIAGMAREYLGRLPGVSAGMLRVVDKMPANFLHAGLIHTALPRARIIHMQRHPIDTCLSIYFQNFFNMGAYANDLGDLAHYYSEYQRIMDHWRALLPAATLLEIPYEGLIQDQEGWSRRLLDFIGLAWDPRCLDFHLTERVVLTTSKWQVRQKIHSASAGRWRNYATHVGPLLRLIEPRPRAAAEPMTDGPLP